MKNTPRNQFNILPLLKPVGLLFLIVIACSLISRYLYGHGETLQQYADSHAQNIDVQDIDPKVQDIDPKVQDIDPKVPEKPNRIVYKEDFYYEPLGEEMKNYITGVSYPADAAEAISYEDLNYVHVLHYNFDGEITQGELICNQAIARDLVEIFYELYVSEYRIDKITLIETYDGDNNASMADNNTSCFNYRTVTGQDDLSQHAFGLAIDINPFYNPCIRFPKEGGQIVLPEGSEAYTDRSAAFPYKIDTDDFCYKLFIAHGFTWGGNRNSMKDYQHFQKEP